MTDAFGEAFVCGLDIRQIHDKHRVVLRKLTCAFLYKLVLLAPSTDRLSYTTAVRVGFRGQGEGALRAA